MYFKKLHVCMYTDTYNMCKIKEYVQDIVWLVGQFHPVGWLAGHFGTPMCL